MNRARGHHKSVHEPVSPMHGVILAFILFVALGSSVLIILDKRYGSRTTQLDGIGDSSGFKTVQIQPKAVEVVTKKTMLLDVPFIPQAPFGNWADPHQEDGCEEASVLMAMRWRTGKTLTKGEGLSEILAISQYQEDTYGTYNDTSAADTIERIVQGYFKYEKARLAYRITKEDIMNELAANRVVIVPVNGRKLFNPNYTSPGPLEHMLVIRGYDLTTNEFITNDPGTRLGENYRYDMELFMGAIRDYPTGVHVTPNENAPSAMIVIDKK